MMQLAQHLRSLAARATYPAVRFESVWMSPHHPFATKTNTGSGHTAKEAKEAAEAKVKAQEQQKEQHGTRDEPHPMPTYTYASPGSSLKEAGYGIGMSFSDPVYVIDPAPKPKKNQSTAPGIKPEEVGEDFQQPGSDGVPPPPPPPQTPAKGPST